MKSVLISIIDEIVEIENVKTDEYLVQAIFATATNHERKEKLRHFSHCFSLAFSKNLQASSASVQKLSSFEVEQAKISLIPD